MITTKDIEDLIVVAFKGYLKDVFDCVQVDCSHDRKLNTFKTRFVADNVLAVTWDIKEKDILPDGFNGAAAKDVLIDDFKMHAWEALVELRCQGIFDHGEFDRRMEKLEFAGAA